MDYESFKEKFVEDVKDRPYEQGAEVDLSIHTVNKLNESYEAITVTPEGSNIGVNIGIDKFYGAVENGRPCGLLRELDEFGLIERKKQGLGKPTIIYVKDFTRFRKAELLDSDKWNSGQS